VTTIEVLDGFLALATKPATWQRWHCYPQTRANGRPIASMLASCPDERPTAHQIVRTFFHDSLPPMEWVRTGSTGLSPEIPRLPPQETSSPRDTSNQISHAQSLLNPQTRREKKSKPRRVIPEWTSREVSIRRGVKYMLEGRP
jgi:hypothetical protein